MQWAILILVCSGIYGLGASFYLLRKTERLKFMALFWASVTFFFVEVSQLVDIGTTANYAEFITAQIIEWGHVYCIVLVLGALMLFIRESKPEFSRFPRFYSVFPVILAISYLLVYDTIVLKKWLLSLSEAGAAIVAVIMYGMYSYYETIYRTVFAGAILFLITFMMQLFLPASLNLVWQITLATGIITIFTGYLLVDRYFAQDYEQ